MNKENARNKLETGGDLFVGEVINCKKVEFRIPSYQRGYRWRAEIEVKNFIQKIKDNHGQIECIQPLVLKKKEVNNDGTTIYNVVDGQQRLTTISILIDSCKNGLEITQPKITYETRNNRMYNNCDMLTDGCYSQIDDYYIEQARKQCAEDIKDEDKWHIILKLLYNFYFICHIIGEEEDELEVFTRLNAGKIPLTNSELTKAYLLDEVVENNSIIEFCQEWDGMTKLFEKNDFWYFLCPDPENRKYEQSRLDYLLEIVSYDKENSKNHDANVAKSKNLYDHYMSFHILQEKVKKCEITKEDLWNKIKKYYRALRFWYEDSPGNRIYNSQYSFYHLVGYKTVTSRGKNISHIEFLHNLLEGDKSKKGIYYEIKESIEREFGEDIGKAKEKISKFSYDNRKDKSSICNFLLLINILTLEKCESMNTRYPFAQHVKEEWSLEHIHAKEEKYSEDLLNLYLKIIDPQKAKEIKDSNPNREQQFYECIHFFESPSIKKTDTESHEFSYKSDIGNLALLSKDLNSKVNASPFYRKREIIQEQCKDKNVVIPICTLYAFFKYYSPEDKNNIIWTADNAIDYIEVELKLIENFYKDNRRHDIA